MTCVGSAFGFLYTCCSATVLSKHYGDKKQTAISALGICVAAVFLIITFIPGMPGFLSKPSWIILGVWVIMGLVFYFQIRGEYEHGRWDGVSVEDILYSKMLQDGKLPDGAELPHNSIYYDKRKAAK